MSGKKATQDIISEIPGTWRSAVSSNVMKTG